MKTRTKILCLLMNIVMVLGYANHAVAYQKEIQTVSAEMARNISAKQKKDIAVVDFTDLQGNVTELGRFIAEEVSIALLNTAQGFEVVDRTHLKTLLQEHKLSSTGLIDPATARKLGQLVGVDALITGTVTPFGDTIRLAIKILDVNTAKMIGANSIDIPKTKAIEELLATGISGETSPSRTTPAGTTLKAQQSVESKGFTFALQGCKKAGDSVICHLLITNQSQDRKLVINGTDHDKSRLFDDFGNEYIAKQVQIGNDNGTRDAENLLPSGVPMRASLNFENVSSQAKVITLLELECFIGDFFKVQFRNLPFSN